MKKKAENIPVVAAPVTVVAPKYRTVIAAVKKPLNAIGSFFWDSKSQSFSIPRLQFLLTSVFGAALVWDVRNIIVDAYKANREIPDLEWYLALIIAYIGSGPIGYGFSKIGSRHDRYPQYDPVVINKDEIKE